MELETVREIHEALKKKGVSSTIAEGYSGRGMYGKTTTGLVINDSEDAFFTIQVMGDFGVHDARTDNMGKGIIYY
jgi:hypothetical protein